jgi:hypothetical protein
MPERGKYGLFCRFEDLLLLVFNLQSFHLRLSSRSEEYESYL